MNKAPVTNGLTKDFKDCNFEIFCTYSLLSFPTIIVNYLYISQYPKIFLKQIKDFYKSLKDFIAKRRAVKNLSGLSMLIQSNIINLLTISLYQSLIFIINQYRKDENQDCLIHHAFQLDYPISV